MIPKLLCGLLLASLAYAGPALLVLSKGDLTLSMVDPATLKVVWKVPSGPDPHEVIASTDGRLAFISNYGRGAHNTITVVDLVAGKSAGTVDLGALRGPHGLDFAGGKLWFTAETAKIVASYDPATKKVDLIIGTGQNRTHMVYVQPDAKRMFTTDVNSATVTVIEKGATDWEEAHIAVGKGAEGFDVAPGGKELWTANATDGTISVVDIAGRTAISIAANVGGANRLKFTPDGKLALVSTLRGPNVTVVDAVSRMVMKTVKVGTGAAGIQMQPDGARAFVACTPDSYVAVLDLKTLDVTGRFEVGKQPDGMAWTVIP